MLASYQTLVDSKEASGLTAAAVASTWAKLACSPLVARAVLDSMRYDGLCAQPSGSLMAAILLAGGEAAAELITRHRWGICITWRCLHGDKCVPAATHVGKAVIATCWRMALLATAVHFGAVLLLFMLCCSLRCHGRVVPRQE